MINFLKKYWFLIAVLILAAFLRFYQLGTYPALNADEASNAYDAYSLIQTGMDQHGNTWPVAFQSFNDYKPGLYVYLDMPFVKFMGLTPLAARIPGALAGVLSVLVLYFLVNEPFISSGFGVEGLNPKHKTLNRSETLALISSLFLAISPWHIQFSRGGWEVNVATLFIILGVYSFLRFVRTNGFAYLAFSIFNLALSLYAYHAARVVVPLLGIAALVIYKKEIFVSKNLKNIIVAVLFGILVVTPLVIDLSKPGALSRVAGVGLFADPGPINRINEQRGEHADVNSLSAKLIHNKVVNYGLAFLDNWSAHYHGLFLFVSGDDVQRDKVPETGEMYLFDIALVLVGIAIIFKDYKQNPKSYALILTWLVIAPIPAALTFQAPSALRAESMAIPLIIISSLGFVYLLGLLKTVKKSLRVGGWVLMAIFIGWSFARYMHMYWVHMAKEYPFSSQYGVKELVSYVIQNQDKYKNIVVTDKYDQPYILFLFYMKYPPNKFQFHHSLSIPDQYGFSTVREFAKYRFITFSDWNSIRNEYPNSLIIGTPEEIPPEANIVKKIYGENGYEYFDVVAN